MSDPMWSGGPDQFQDRYPDVWAVLPSFMQDPLLPQATPLSPLAMSGVCLLLTQVSIYGAYGGWAFGQYQIYYGDAYRASPPGTHTDDVPTVTVPTPYEPPVVAGPNYDWQYGQLNDALLTILDFLGPWVAPDNLHVQIAAITDALAALGGSGTPTTAKDTARILAAIYYVAQLPFTISATIDDTAILAAVADAASTINANVDDVDTNINGVASAIQGRFDTVDSSLSSLASGHGDILDAIAAIEPGGGTAGAPVWPGLANVTIGEGVALVNGLHLTGAMDGVIVSITTPPTKTGLMDIGGAMFDYREGQVAFEDDNGEVETWQYLGFRQAIFVPKTMKQASGARFRVLAGAEGMVYPWTVTV